MAQLQERVGDLLRACAGILETSAALTVSAGPFRSLAKVREFERRLTQIPGVQEVTLRGYEGEDRAVFDVRLT
jgi:hypothetical protein